MNRLEKCFWAAILIGFLMWVADAFAVPTVFYKVSAECSSIQKETYHAIRVAAKVWQEAGAGLLVTSCTDYWIKRVPNSLHALGFAVDLSTKGISRSVVQELAEKLQRELGNYYDVVIESSHVHVEFDPKIPKEFRP